MSTSTVLALFTDSVATDVIISASACVVNSVGVFVEGGNAIVGNIVSVVMAFGSFVDSLMVLLWL